MFELAVALFIQGAVFGGFCAYIAGTKNRSQFNWFILGGFFSLIALITIAVVPALDKAQNLATDKADSPAINKTDSRPAWHEENHQREDKPVGLILLLALTVVITILFIYGNQYD